MLDHAHGNIYLNAGIWDQIQIRPNFQKFSQNCQTKYLRPKQTVKFSQ